MVEQNNWNGRRIKVIDLGKAKKGIRCQHPDCKKPLNPKRKLFKVDGGLIIGSCCIRRGMWNRLDKFFQNGALRNA